MVAISRWWMVCAVCSAARLSTPAPPEPLPHLYASANQLPGSLSALTIRSALCWPVWLPLSLKYTSFMKSNAFRAFGALQKATSYIRLIASPLNNKGSFYFAMNLTNWRNRRSLEVAGTQKQPRCLSYLSRTIERAIGMSVRNRRTRHRDSLGGIGWGIVNLQGTHRFSVHRQRASGSYSVAMWRTGALP